MLLRARIVLPVARPPIANGAVRVHQGRIAAVGRWADLARPAARDVTDLGEVVLLPGLINAHCHLDYTDMAGLLPPQRSFADWIKLITATRAEWGLAEFRQSWLRGAAMLLRTGTTTVADVESVPDLLPEVWHATPLRVVSFLEMTGIRARRAPGAILQAAVDKIARLPRGRCRAGLSPHAPYSTLPELLRGCARTARRRHWLVTTHVAESDEEFEMFTRRRGALCAWLARNERDMTDCGRGTPVQQLARAGLLGPNLLAVHANYLGRGDAALLARHGVSVVHCPRSHRYFGHRAFPLRALQRAGVNLCLGTDSLATVLRPPRQRVQLSLFEELQELARQQPRLAAQTLLDLVTRNPARALGRAGRLGELTPGAWADLIAVPYTGPLAAACDAVLQHTGPVTATMIAGQWVSAPDSGGG